MKKLYVFNFHCVSVIRLKQNKQMRQFNYKKKYILKRKERRFIYLFVYLFSIFFFYKVSFVERDYIHLFSSNGNRLLLKLNLTNTQITKIRSRSSNIN